MFDSKRSSALFLFLSLTGMSATGHALTCQDAFTSRQVLGVSRTLTEIESKMIQDLEAKSDLNTAGNVDLVLSLKDLRQAKWADATVRVFGSKAYVIEGRELTVVSLANGAEEFRFSLPLDGVLYDVAPFGPDQIAIATRDALAEESLVAIYSMSTKTMKSRYRLPGADRPLRIKPAGRKLLILSEASDATYEVIELNARFIPKVLFKASIGDRIEDFEARGEKTFLLVSNSQNANGAAAKTSTLLAFDSKLGDPNQNFLLSSTRLSNQPNSLRLAGDILYVAGEYGIHAYHYQNVDGHPVILNGTRNNFLSVDTDGTVIYSYLMPRDQEDGVGPVQPELATYDVVNRLAARSRRASRTPR